MTKTSVVYGIGNLKSQKQKVLKQHPTVEHSWQDTAALFATDRKRKKESEVAQPCPTLCDPMVHVIFQARILKRVAISFSRRSSWPRDWTWVSCIVGRRFTIWTIREVRGWGRGGEEATIYRENWCQVHLLIIRETSSWDREQAWRQLLIKPYNWEDWIVIRVKQGLVEQGMFRQQENSHLEWPDYTDGKTVKLNFLSWGNKIFTFR